MTITERRIPSADGVHQLFCRVYQPDGEIKGLFHVVHGMNEHIDRYVTFLREMTEHGYLCYAFDNLGHGRTVNDDSELGFLVDWRFMVDDVQNVSKQMKREYGDGLPCFLLGHSMGSFIARCASDPKIWNKVIYMGTGGPNPASKPGLALIKLRIRQEGQHAVSPEIEKMAFGSYRKHFEDESDPIAWLSTQTEVRDAYRQDKYCTFSFTLNGYYNLIKLQSLSNSKTWFKHISDELPIFLVSGTDDPVGNYGKGVTAVYKQLNRCGKNVKMKLYEGYRHEILNDVCHDEVVQDILDFIQ